MTDRVLIIGAGVTGLAAGIASGGTVLEATSQIGGLASCDTDGGYVFGYSGHWLFGGTPATQRWVRQVIRCNDIERSAYVHLNGEYIPAPIQSQIDHFDDAPRIYAEMAAAPSIEPETFAEWLQVTYGRTLYSRFFRPFNGKYTRDLMFEVEPMYSRNAGASLESLLRGSKIRTYNERFLYAVGGIHNLAWEMAGRCERVVVGAEVIHIDLANRTVTTREGIDREYDVLISTVPLNELLALIAGENDIGLPYLSGVVVNIGCGTVRFPGHWAYIPDHDIIFHRIGNYTAVDETLAPRGKHLVYIDVNLRPESWDTGQVVDRCVKEAVEHGFIDDVDEGAIDARYIKTSYTLTRPGQRKLVNSTLEWLSDYNVFSIGGYGRWQYQGMMADIEEGFRIGAMAREL